MTWGRALENALASKGISKEFEEWVAIAKDRPKWRQQTHSNPRPLDALLLTETSRENHHNFFTRNAHSAQSETEIS